MSLYYSKKIRMDKRGIMSLDILNFVHISDFPFYEKWEANRVSLIHGIIDKERKTFFTFEKFKNKIPMKNYLKYHSLV